MDGILTYLNRYKNLTPPNKSKIKTFVSVVSDEIGILIEEENVSIKRNGVLLDCHPTVRSEVVRSAPKIINILNSKHNIRLSFIR